MCPWLIINKFLLTLSATASNNSNHAVNLINFRKNSPGKAKPKENSGIKDGLFLELLTRMLLWKMEHVQDVKDPINFT